jgi:hypothetical protein
MTERTLSGRVRLRRTPRAAGKKKNAQGPEAFTNLGPIIWSIAMLTFSVALAAAAVFSHKPL